MSVNARLDAAETHFGQDAATLSMVLQMRQRKVRLIKLRSGQWMTSERDNWRKAFSTKVVTDALEMGLLRTEGTNEDGPSLLALTYEGEKLAGEVLEWLKPKPPEPVKPVLPDVGEILLGIIEDDALELDASYTEADLLEGLRRTFTTRSPVGFDDLQKIDQDRLLQQAKDLLEERNGWVCVPEE